MSEILLTEQLASSVTPTAGRVVIYAKTDGYLYFKDDTGQETRVNMQVVKTAAQWVSSNPVLAEGVFGVESDTMKFKIGDGVTQWNTLAYWRYTAEHLTINTAGGNTVLTLAQARASSFAVTGALVSAANIIVQDTMALFVAENLTTGAHTVTFKTAAGTGIVVPQGAHATLYADGVNVELPTTAGIGSGDVVGPASSVNNNFAAYNGTTGKLIKDSGVNTASFEPANANIQTHIGSTSNPHSVTKTQVGLGNVDNTSDANKPVSTAQASADTTAENNAKAYADTLVVGLWDDRGAYDASVNTFPASGGSGTAGAILKGDIWVVSVAGILGGAAVGIGDTVRALVNTPGQTASNWALQENNIGYVPENAANKVTSISGASTDTQYPSAKLVYDQLALKAPLNAPTFTGTVGGITAAMVGAPSGSGTSSGTNTGDQASIVGITGTLAQFNTAVSDADLLATNGVGSDVTLARVAGSTYSTLQHWRNNMASAGVIAGGVISDAGGGNINVTTGSCAIRPTTSHTSTLYFADFPANNGIAIPANTIRYVGVEYNAGSPVVAIRAADNFDYMTNFPLGVITNEAGTLHLHTADRHDIADADSHVAERFEHTANFARDEVIGGLILGETGTRNITMSAGALWQKLIRLDITAFNSSTGGTFDIYYRDGAGSFTKVAAATQWPNTQFDNGTGVLATLASNKYAVCWFYLEADDSDIIMLYGRAEHGSIAAAEAESPPATVPNRVTAGARILGKLVFQKSAATASSVSSVFTQAFSTTGASVHSNLSNLDYASAGHTGFATSAQGALADSALQAAAIGTTVQAYDADLTTWAGVTPGTGVATALAIAVGSAGAPVVNGGALGTPSSGTLDACTSNTEAAANNSTRLATTAYADRLTAGTLAGAFTTVSATVNQNNYTSVTVSNTTDGTISMARFVAISNAGSVGFGVTAPSYTDISGAADAMVFNCSNLSGGYQWCIDSAPAVAAISSTGLAVTGTISSTTTIKTGGYTVGTLPAGVTGDRAYVTDATAPTYLGALTGGGAVVCPVFKNASAWVSA